MANEEKEKKEKKKKTVKIEPDNKLENRVISSASPVKDKGKGKGSK
jgi:hypothetical protein